MPHGTLRIVMTVIVIVQVFFSWSLRRGSRHFRPRGAQERTRGGRLVDRHRAPRISGMIRVRNVHAKQLQGVEAPGSKCARSGALGPAKRRCDDSSPPGACGNRLRLRPLLRRDGTGRVSSPRIRTAAAAQCPAGRWIAVRTPLVSDQAQIPLRTLSALFQPFF